MPGNLAGLFGQGESKGVSPSRPHLRCAQPAWKSHLALLVLAKPDTACPSGTAVADRNAPIGANLLPHLAVAGKLGRALLASFFVPVFPPVARAVSEGRNPAIAWFRMRRRPTRLLNRALR